MFSAQAIIGNLHHTTAAPVQKKRFLVDSTYFVFVLFNFLSDTLVQCSY